MRFRWEYGTMPDGNCDLAVLDCFTVSLPTDGVYETTNPAGAMFGIERTVATVREHSQQSAIEIVQTLYLAARGFSEGVQQQDDITAVVIKATG